MAGTSISELKRKLTASQNDDRRVPYLRGVMVYIPPVTPNISFKVS